MGFVPVPLSINLKVGTPLERYRILNFKEDSMIKKAGLKKLLVVVMVLVMMSTVIAGCGGTGDAGKAAITAPEKTAAADAVKTEPVKLAFWTIYLRPTFDNFFNGVFEQYKKDHANVTIDWVDMPYDAIQNKLITAAAGGNCPDIVNLNTQMALILAGKDILTNLDTEATEEQRSVYVKSLYESAKTSKGAFAFPWYGAPSVMIYNKDLFAKAGITTPPTTFDEMLTAGAAMKAKTGAYFFIPDEFRHILFLEGVPLISEDKKTAAFNTPEALEILNKYKKAADQGIIPKNNWGAWDKMLQQFNTGKLAMMNTGAQSIKRVKDEAPNIYKNVEVAPAMVGKAGVILNPIMNIVVPKLSKNVKEAVNFAAFVTNDDNQLGFAKAVQIFPSTIKAAQDPFFKSDVSKPETKAISIAADELLKTADMSLAITKEMDVFTALNKAAESVVLGNTDPKKALDEAEKKVNEVLAQEPQ